MNLWLDKYRPRDFQKLDYHLDQAKNLKKLTSDGDFPHLLVYGPPGAGKKTRIMCLLRELYGAGVEKLRIDQMQFTTPSNKKIDLSTVSSNYHIEVNPSDVGMYDRIVVMDLIKKMAQTQQLDSAGQRDFKIVVLTDVDLLSKDAQHALRRTMEKYIKNCRLILSANSTSRVIPALQSRCLSIRVPAPSHEVIVHVLQKIAKKEGLTLPPPLAQRIAVASNRNLRRAILMMEAAKVEKYPFADDQPVREPDWERFIKNVAEQMLREQSIDKIASVRSMLYELITHGIPHDIIFKTLLDKLLDKCDISLKEEVAHAAAVYEHHLRNGNKEIYHLEAFVAKFMYLYKKFLEAAMEEF